MKRIACWTHVGFALALLLITVQLCGCGAQTPEPKPYRPAEERIAAGEATVVQENYEENRLYYTLLSDHTAILTDARDHGLGDIPWSLTVEGETYTVTAIGEEAFRNGRAVVLTIPACVREIGPHAFQECKELSSFTFEGSEPLLTGSQFIGCKSLLTIKMNGKNSPYEVVDGTLMSRDKTRLIRYPAATEPAEYTVPKGVTEISEYAFDSCGKLAAVALPEDLLTVGRGAFSGCAQLSEITLPSGVTRIEDETFSGCTRLTEPPLGDAITWIGESAFSDCSALSHIELPRNLVHLSDNAFEGCNNLKKVLLPESIQPFEKGIPASLISCRLSIQEDSTVFREEDGMLLDASGTRLFRWQGPEYAVSFSVPEGVTDIETCALRGYRNLVSIVLPDGLLRIGAAAFSGCESLEDLTMPESLREIDDFAFARCFKLASVALPAELTRIGDGCFNQCRNLRELIWPNDLQSIGNRVFSYCGALTSLVIPDSVTEIGEGAFEQCSGLAEIAFPDSLRAIGKEAFRECTALTGVVLPDSVRTIGSSAFSGCTALTSVTFPSNIEEIGGCAFEACTVLEHVDLSHGVGKLGWKAFSGCSALTDVVIAGNGETALETTFYECGSLKSASLSGISVTSSSFNECRNLVRVDIPDCLKELGFHTFYHCDRLSEVTLPDSLAVLGNEVFSNCKSLTHIEIPAGIVEVPDSAFFSCVSLTDVSLPDGLKRIGSSAFRDCVVLEDIALPADLVFIGDRAFQGTCVHPEIPEGVSLGEDVMPDYGVWVPGKINQRIRAGELTRLAENPGYRGKLIISVINHQNTFAGNAREEYYRENCGPNTYAALAETPEEADTLIDIFMETESAGFYTGSRGVVGGATRVFTKVYVVDLHTDSYYEWTAAVGEPPRQVSYTENSFPQASGQFQPEVVFEEIEKALAGSA